MKVTKSEKQNLLNLYNILVVGRGLTILSIYYGLLVVTVC